MEKPDTAIPRAIKDILDKLSETDRFAIRCWLAAAESAMAENVRGDTPAVREATIKMNSAIEKERKTRRELNCVIASQKRLKQQLRGEQRKKSTDADAVYKLGRLHAIRDIREKLQIRLEDKKWRS